MKIIDEIQLSDEEFDPITITHYRKDAFENIMGSINVKESNEIHRKFMQEANASRFAYNKLNNELMNKHNPEKHKIYMNFDYVRQHLILVEK